MATQYRHDSNTGIVRKKTNAAGFEIKEDEKSKTDTGDQFGTTGGVGGSGGVPQATPASPVAQQQRSQHVNVQDYVAANTDAGAKMAGQVGDTVKGGIQGAQSAVDKAQEQLTELAGQEASKYGQAEGIAQQIDEDATQFSGLSGQAELPEPPQYEYSVEDVHYLTDAQAQADALRGIYDQVSQSAYDSRMSAEDAAKLAGKVRTERGRYDLLRQSLGGAGYTTGEQRLDQTLVQSEGRDALRQLQEDALRSVSGLEDTYNKYAEDIGSQFDQESDESLFGQARAARELVGGAIGTWGPEGTGAFGELYSQIAERASNLEGLAQDQMYAILTKLNESGLSSLTNEELKLIGLRPGQMVIQPTKGPKAPETDADLINRSTYGMDFTDELFNRPDYSGMSQEALMSIAIQEDEQNRLNALRELQRTQSDIGLLPEDVELPEWGLNTTTFENAVQAQRQNVLSDMADLSKKNQSAQYETSRYQKSALMKAPKIHPDVIQNAQYFRDNPKDMADFLNNALGLGQGGSYSNTFANPVNVTIHRIEPDPNNPGELRVFYQHGGYMYATPLTSVKIDPGAGTHSMEHAYALAPLFAAAAQIYPDLGWKKPISGGITRQMLLS